MPTVASYLHPRDEILQAMERIYRRVALNNRRYGLSYRNSKAGCTRCGACSGMIAFESTTQG